MSALLRHAVGPEPERPEAADAPDAAVVAVGVEAMRSVVGFAEAANVRRQADVSAEGVAVESEAHHEAIIA